MVLTHRGITAYSRIKSKCFNLCSCSIEWISIFDLIDLLQLPGKIISAVRNFLVFFDSLDVNCQLFLPLNNVKMCTLMKPIVCVFVFIMSALAVQAQEAQPRLEFIMPTENRTLLEGDLETFYQPTISKRAVSGRYGFVRTGGPEPPKYLERFHEGIDVRPLRRDAKGEPLDPVLAAAPGEVVYVNSHASASNYGIYVVIRHRFGSHDLFSFSGHLASASVRTGQQVAAGDPIGILGYTGAGINKERAHLHYEITFRLQESYDRWFKKEGHGFGGDRVNLHGDYNGLGYLGVDPARLLIATARGEAPTVHELFADLQAQFHVMVPAGETYWYWQKNFPFQVEGGLDQPLPRSWKMTVNRIGIPLRFERSDENVEQPYVSWFRPYDRLQDYFTRGLVAKKGGNYILTGHGKKWLSQLGYRKPEEKKSIFKHPRL